MTLSVEVVVALIGVAGSFLVAMLTTRKEARKSAAEMYTQLCEDQQARINQLQAHMTANEAEIKALQKELEVLRAENRNLRGRIAELERENEDLRRQIATLRRETGCGT